MKIAEEWAFEYSSKSCESPILKLDLFEGELFLYTDGTWKYNI
jgi:hypothetical protein